MKVSAMVLALAVVGAPGAASAQAAQSAAPAAPGIPRGMVSFFQLNECPGGWTDVSSNWRGRYIVATVGAEAPGQVVGAALQPGENRPAGAHTHRTTGRAFTGGNCPSKRDGCASWGDADAIQRNVLKTDDGGLKAGTNAPYVSLRACVKN